MNKASLNPAFTKLLRDPLPGEALPLSVTTLLLPLSCVLCGARAVSFNGMFQPIDQKAVGAPPGKVRLLRYSLCQRCHALPDWMKRVDAKLMADLAALRRAN
jgi:hypothetical protein